MNPACALLVAATVYHPPPLGTEVAEPDALCVQLDLDMAGSGAFTTPDVGLNPRMTLDRDRIEGGIYLGPHASARVAFTGSRSAPETGYVGIDGEAIVPKLQIAEARLTLPAQGLSLAAGMIDDPWVFSANRSLGFRAPRAMMAQEQGWMFRSDLGGMVGFTAPQDWVSASLTVTSGEGQNLRERNSGKNVTGMVTVRPLANLDEDVDLGISVMGRDGSRGVQQARDHRLGVRVDGQWAERVRGGVEVLKNWGVGGDSGRAPYGGSVYAIAHPLPPTLVLARFDLVQETPGVSDASKNRFLAGLGARLPFRDGFPAHALLAWDYTHAGPQSSSLAGADGVADIHTVFLQIGVRARWLGVFDPE